VPLIWRRDDWLDGGCGNLALMAQGFNEQLMLPMELFVICEVLPLTTTTLTGD